MPEICKTDIRVIERLLRQCSEEIEVLSSPTSPARDLVRRCNKMRKKLSKSLSNQPCCDAGIINHLMKPVKRTPSGQPRFKF
nr:MAG TPA: hypothetical protein [Caudoviricetes sp.]